MDLLDFVKMRISVSGNCLDNAYAEQRNSMIKHHFLPLKRGRNEIEFNKGLAEIQYEYNTNKTGWDGNRRLSLRMRLVSKKYEQRCKYLTIKHI
ncbi:MAG: hypothetical protein IPN87_01015 [Saprospiraceae bacterium]|nr:hypothetical protein [Candidatus Brachybacter algidus]